jgi:hypothetical protein
MKLVIFGFYLKVCPGVMPWKCIGNLEMKLQLDLRGQIHAQDVLQVGTELLYNRNRKHPEVMLAW